MGRQYLISVATEFVRNLSQVTETFQSPSHFGSAPFVAHTSRFVTPIVPSPPSR